MKSRLFAAAIASFALVAALTAPVIAHAAAPDWKAVEQALGKSGQMQPGDVFRIGMPRTDLSVTVKGVPVKPAFALGSYAAFKQIGDHAMVMGDPATAQYRRHSASQSRAHGFTPALLHALLGKR